MTDHLDRIAAEQAAYYGTTPKALGDFMADVALYDEMQTLVDNGWTWAEVLAFYNMD